MNAAKHKRGAKNSIVASAPGTLLDPIALTQGKLSASLLPNPPTIEPTEEACASQIHLGNADPLLYS